MIYKGKTIWEKLGTHFFTKLICPKKNCIDLLLWGKGISEIALILSGYIYIPCLETMNPRSFRSLK